MNVWAQLSLFTATASVVLGVYILAKNPRNRLNASFLLFCASIAYYAFTEYKYREATGYTEAGFWIRAGSVYPLILSFMLFFLVVFLEKEEWLQKKTADALIFAPGLLLTFFEFLSGGGRGLPVEEYWGWTYSLSTNLLSIVEVVWVFVAFFFSYYLIVSCYKYARDEDKKQQAKWIGLGTITSSLITIITTGMIRRFGFTFPNLAAPSFLIMFLCTSWAMWKHKLFVITPATIAENIISTMSNFVLAVDVEGIIVAANPAARELLQYGEDELIGQPLEVVLAETEVTGATTRWTGRQRRLEKHSSRSFQTVFITSKKEKVPVLVSISPIQETADKRTGSVLVGSDLRPFLELDDIQEKFVTTVAYELKSPVAGIYLTIKNIQKLAAKLPGEQMASMHDSIEIKANQLVEMIENLQFISELGTRKLRPRPTPYNLAAVLQNVLTAMQPRIAEKGLGVELDGLSEIPLFGDEKMIIRTCRVLLDNAVKYSDEKTQIRIKLVDPYRGNFNPLGVDGVLLQVKDEGWGVPERDIKHLFSRFYRGDNVKNVSGSGLGLFIARQLVSLHGGEIFVESGSGKGSTFSVFLPRVDLLSSE
ncbi:MAG: ATP-binding protein [Candidatus Odinarchaeota archaeon]